MTRRQGVAQRSGRAERPLVVVSNRLPFSAVRRGGRLTFVPSAGGLVSALEPALQQHGGVWIGWSGIARDGAGARTRLPAGQNVRYHAVPLTAREVNLYYGEVANRTIWPLFHFFVSRTQISGPSWRAYERVNQRFAEAAAAEADNA